ncbi:L-lactate permease [Acetobacter sp.]|uniref:L-lactate permease n=1 Tax=Acetobacter sp. TaxID=440 RepID=UPI0025C36005|nr:L-lactate permease [Acetobacter sp.]MCH4091609.1 L-lactate permease [Acetobacter sp.]MCI1301173.1 L-lactate permease [Acetobacter sp.]MCI1317423.1 L-lactate permease [Acetobacter sp.]
MGSVSLSCLAAATPIIVALFCMGVMKWAAWKSTFLAMIAGVLIALFIWHMPLKLAALSISYGVTFSLFPVMWIALTAILLFNLTIVSGYFDTLRAWITANLPEDRRILLVVIGFCFGALLEGIAGFGSPVAVTSSLLIAAGFAPLEALTYVLIFDTAPVAFGGLGIPVTVLGSVTGLPASELGAVIGHLLPPIALILPFYVMAFYAGAKSVRAIWPVLLVAGASFAFCQFFVSNFLSYSLTDIASSTVSLVATVAFLKFWQPRPDRSFNISWSDSQTPAHPARALWRGWLPWIIVTCVIIGWDMLKLNTIMAFSIPWPGLHKNVHISLYNTDYAAIWKFEPFGTGTAIFISGILFSVFCRISPRKYVEAVIITLRQGWIAVVSVALTLGLAYLMNYSGMTYTLGFGAASSGPFFYVLSVLLGWVAVFLTGSDTSGNALFGNLQVSAARSLHLNPLLFAAANSAGGVMGKMISPQNIATGVAVTNLKGREGDVLRKTWAHSIALSMLLVVIVIVYQWLGTLLH